MEHIMATPPPPPSLYELNPGEPIDFVREFKTWIQIQYEFDDQGEYVFSYRSDTTMIDDESLLLGLTSSRNDWTPFWRAGSVIEPIDINIKHGDTLVAIETLDSSPNCKLYWSLNYEALKTREDRSLLYGELKYKQRDGWKRRTQYTATNLPRLIRFKANLNEDDRDAVHKFSYFVKLMDSTGTLVEFEIDPDIKNPSF